MNTRYWTLGEEWEHNFAELQSLPPRCCFIKHKIQGGMLPIQTANIEPAFKVLGMSPEEYPAYLAGLPFGRKYLLERSSLLVQTPQPTANAAQTAPPREAKPEVPEVKPQQVKPQFQLEELQQAFLEFIIANPDTPMTTVYKGIGVGISKGNQIRDALKELRLIEEIESRLGKGGRPTKFYIPTFTALELLGKQPPNGRGGIVHRHIQHLIEEEATAKGYSAKCEYNIGNGGILDVHLDNGLIKIAVEIAVYSTPQREIAHIKDALEAGYDKVYNVFADQRTLERTQEAVQAEFSEKERAKIRLLHLSKLSNLV